MTGWPELLPAEGRYGGGLAGRRGTDRAGPDGGRFALTKTLFGAVNSNQVEFIKFLNNGW